VRRNDGRGFAGVPSGHPLPLAGEGIAVCDSPIILSRLLKKSEAVGKPMVTRPKTPENKLVKLFFGQISGCFVEIR
jgi:hypothetical protein